ncbi:MAG: O-antigen polymerase [Pseudomonadota bacterium]
MPPKPKAHPFLSPSVLYIVGFIAPFLLVFIGFSKEVHIPSEETLAVIMTGIASFFSGVLFASVFFLLARQKTIRTNSTGELVLINEKQLANRLTIAWFLCFAMLWFEFYKLGALPLISASAEELRFKMQFNGLTHLLAISTGFIAFLFFTLIQVSRDKRLKKVYASLIALSITSLAMTANRIDFMYPIFLMTIFYILHNGRIVNKKTIIILIATVTAFVGLNIYRSSQHSEQFISDITYGLGDNFPPTDINIATYPLYMTLTYSFEMLDKLVNNGIEAMTGGLYTFYAIYSLKPGPEISFGEFKNEALGINFYAELTSTYLSNFYVDFGTPGVAIGSFIYGGITQYLWMTFKSDKKYITLYTITGATIIFTFYAFYYIYFYALVQIAITLYATKHMRQTTGY